LRINVFQPYFSGSTNNTDTITINGNRPNIFSTPADSPVLTKPITKDVYTPSVTTEQKTASQKFIEEAQDKIYAKLFPDKFIAKYINKSFLEQAVKNNPRITQLLASEGLVVTIEPHNMSSITKSHLLPTAKYAKIIMQNSGEYYTPNDYDLMQEAALIHDIGKSLIPAEILNKKEKLTQKEREIIKLHNDLGYEILKSSSLSPRVLALIQNHHDYRNEGPKDSMSQILTVADIYSALKEVRPYKPQMSDEDAFKILEEGANRGDYNINYVNSLRKALANPVSEQTTEQLAKAA